MSEYFPFAEEIDSAAEFAALEGRSLTEALAEFRDGTSLPLTADPPNLTRHSEGVATAARELARLSGIDPETAFTAGLVHDIGRFGGLRREWMDVGFPVVYAEALVCGVDHAEWGASCLRVWGFPGDIVEAVAMHHRPERSSSRLASVLTLAEDFTSRAAEAPSEDFWPDLRRTAACLTAGITLGRFEEFCSLHFQPNRICA